jgi:hypothetical protein
LRLSAGQECKRDPEQVGDFRDRFRQSDNFAQDDTHHLEFVGNSLEMDFSLALIRTPGPRLIRKPLYVLFQDLAGGGLQT